MKSTILITGATGMVGRHLLDICEERNIKVHYLTRKVISNVKTEFLKSYYWNPEHNDINEDCFKGVSKIINLAGSSITERWTTDNKNRILTSRTNSIKTLIKGLAKYKKHHVNQIVSASGINIYNSSLDTYYKEDELVSSPSFLGDVVLKWEDALDRFQSMNIQTTKLRIGIVLSDKGGALKPISKLTNSYFGSVIGSGKQWQSWIHAKDLARMFLYVIEHEKTGVYNATAPNPVTQKEFIKTLAKTLGKPVVLKVSSLMVRTLLGKRSELLLESQKVNNQKIIDEGFEFHYPKLDSAFADIFSKK